MDQTIDSILTSRPNGNRGFGTIDQMGEYVLGVDVMGVDVLGVDVMTLIHLKNALN